MFEAITIGRGHCGYCGEWGAVAILDAPHARPPAAVATCERCARATAKAADLLGLIRKAKAPPPKKARKGPQSRASALPLHPAKEAVSSLVPLGDPSP